MMTESVNIPLSFVKWAHKVFGSDVDKIDLEAHYDHDLNESENRDEFIGKFPGYVNDRIAAPTRSQRTEAEREHQMFESDRAENTDFRFAEGKMPTLVAVCGGRGVGKTALCHRLCDELGRDRRIFVLKHPQKEIVERIGYKRLPNLEEIERLQDCVLWIDEIQLHLKRYENSGNDALMRLFTLCRQRGITIVISTSEARYFTRGIEAFVDWWFLLDIEPVFVKRGSMIQKMIRDNVLFSADSFRLRKGEYLFYSRNLSDECGRHKFSLPSYWTEQFSKPYSLSEVEL